MAGLNETPSANRVHIAFFGLRNAGKSTLVNEFTGQPIAIVSDVAGTTTDPVSKAMEILPLGPCVVTDTAGLDDVGELGGMRVRKTLDVLATTDIAVWVFATEGGADEGRERQAFLAECRRRNVTVLDYRRGDSVEGLKRRIAAVRIGDETPGLLEGLAKRGDRVLCVCPIDESAPKGRLILPQVQVIRECLDIGAVATVCQPRDVREVLGAWCLVPGALERALVITDSQAFGEVSRALAQFSQSPGNRTIEQSNNPNNSPVRLTSFSILFARQKGDVKAYVEGLRGLRDLKDGDTVLIAEGCTHHRQCNDIGTVKIPKAISKLTGRRINFAFVSGGAFAIDQSPNPPSIEQSEQSNNLPISRFSLVVQCGGCMLTRREVLRRIALAKEAGVPIVNYGMALALAAGVDIERCVM